MNRDVQALVTDIGHKIEALIEAAVAVRVQGVQAAPRGLGVVDEKPARTKPKPVPAKAKPGRRKQDVPAGMREFVKQALALPANERMPFADRHGVSRSTMYKWIKRIGKTRLARGGAHRKKHTADRKREVVAKARPMAPGDRESYLADEGVPKGTYYKWAAWVKANPA